MKIKNILCAAAAAAVILSSCSGNESSDQVRPLGDYKNVSAGDSLIYYFGQLRAVDYWQYAYNDTTLRSRQSRDEYLRGLKAGLDAAKENDAYNQGLFVGIQLAMNMKEFKDEFDCDFNRSILVNAIADGLQNDSIIDASEANRNFREVLNGFTARKEVTDKQKAVETLAKEGKSQNWTKINDTLYAGKTEGNTSGATYKNGDTVSAVMEMKTIDGRDLDRREGADVTVGESFPGPITDAFLTMHEGETRTFYSTAIAMFGRYYERYNLKPDQIIVLKITSGKVQPKTVAEQTVNPDTTPAE